MPLIGHTSAFETAMSLLNPIKRRSIAIVSPEGVGRQYFAAQLFLAVNEGLGLNLYSEDLRVLRQDMVSVDDIREQDTWISIKPVKAHTKFLVISGTALSGSAQQALLKLLEEPPRHLVIVLYMSSLRELLPATRSRLTPIHLHTLSREDCEKVWHSLGVDASVYNTLWKLAPGLPGLGMQRGTKKFESGFNSFAAFLKNKSRCAISFLHWQSQLPADWNSKDHTDFWLWVTPKLFQVNSLPTSKEAKFCYEVSKHLRDNPLCDTTSLLPALWFEVFGA